MDDHTLEKLDFERVRRLLAQHAHCALGKSLALRVKPSKRDSQVRGWLDQARQFEHFTNQRGMPPFGGVRDVREMVKRAVPPAKLEPEEFAELAGTLHGVDAIRRYFADPPSEGFDAVAKVVARIGDLRVIGDRIGRVIDPRGKVRDDASERLSRIRSEISRVRDETREAFDRLLRNPNIVKYLQYANATFHADRMVLPLKAEQKGRIPGIIHRSSDSGQTLFVEPAEAVELNNRRISLVADETDETNRILWELTHLVHLNQREILNTLEAAAVIDLLCAKIGLARKYDMHLPEINDNSRVILRQARNPILLSMFHPEGTGRRLGTSPSTTAEAVAPNTSEGRSVVPIDVRLGDDFDVMIITGPNTGGKTAALKTVGLLALMAQSGLPIPAAPGSTLPVLQGLWIDVGDEQSLQQSLSTFSAHLARILDIIKRARPSTLVLIDEIGAGTDPDEGAAIGRAIIEHLLESGCLAMVTTHLGALKGIGYEARRADNASVMFNIETLRPTYELRIGEPGNSNAIAIASRLGMPKKIVMRAQRSLATRQRSLQRAIAGTLASRRQAERARRDADQARQDAARQTLAAMDQAKALEAEREEFRLWMEKVLRLQPGDAVRVKGFDDPGKVARVRHERQRVAVSIGPLEVEVPLADLIF